MKTKFKPKHVALAGLVSVMLGLSACSTTPVPTATPLPFKAFGNEPGWMINIQNTHQAEVLLNYGERTLQLDLPTPQISYAGTHYRGTYNNAPLSIDIIFNTCNDTMSDDVFDYEVRFQIEGNHYRGCGKAS